MLKVALQPLLEIQLTQKVLAQGLRVVLLMLKDLMPLHIELVLMQKDILQGLMDGVLM